MTDLPPEPVDILLDGVTHAGEGVGRVFVTEDGDLEDGHDRGGKVVFVPGGLPGERVRVRAVDDRRSWARAELLEVLEASPDRVEPPCPYARFGSAPGPPCGGCQLQHVSDPGELKMKERITREQIERIGKIDAPPVEPIRTVGPSLNYRITARFHATHDEDAVDLPPDERDEVDLGFYAADAGVDTALGPDGAGATDPADDDAADADGVRDARRDVVPIDRCLIVNEGVQALRDGTAAGGADQVTFRAVPSSGTSGIVLHPGPGGLTMPKVAADIGLAEPDGSIQMMRGDGVLEAAVAGFTYRFDLSCFFQVSEAAATALLDEVRLEVGDPSQRNVWDLYAGVGLFSVALAADGANVVAVESHAASVTWLERNAADNGVDLVAVEEDALEWAHAGGVHPDVVVLDPPRGGAGLDVVRALARMQVARIVYVSCDVPAFARDAGDLVKQGYDLERVQPLDCFPQTHHIEVVGTFSLR